MKKSPATSDHRPPLKHLAFLGDYSPRRCGIATFTADLQEAIAGEFPDLQCQVAAVNDRAEGYSYPSPVRFEIEEKDIESYRRAADFLNINNIEVLCVQHEFGIFGGPAGSHLLALLRQADLPVVTTLHTVLSDPDPIQRKVMDELARRSGRLVVMAKKGAEILQRVYGVALEKIDVIPHGIPDIPFVDPNFYKDQFGVEGKTVLLTFGLLGHSKGIEYVIEALPRIVARHPNVVYIVLGATHPNLVAHEGEAYRLSLERRVESLGMKRNVIFYDRYVTAKELSEFIGASDFYLTPYTNPAQITSGTLAYTFGAGKAVISTPYWHAEELLRDDRGVLVPFKNSEAIADAVIDLVENPKRCHAMRKNAWLLGREMTWPVVARKYMESFEKARLGHNHVPRKAFARQTLDQRAYQLPLSKMDHLERLTDSTGILQHAICTVPNFTEGYCTDDNARAYILTVLVDELGGKLSERDLDRLSTSYLAFLWHAFLPETGRFRNFMSYDRRWLETRGSEDSHGRALWALGTALGRGSNASHRSVSGLIFHQGLVGVEKFKSPRAWAFTLLAIHEYLRSFSGDRDVAAMRELLANRLEDLYLRTARPNWLWFEESLSYDNAKLSHALILCGHWTSRPDLLDKGMRSLRWLAEIQTAPSGCFRPIGSNGFYSVGGHRAQFDQQPIEAYAMLSACLEAWRITGDNFWWQEAQKAFEWFLGRNDLGLPLYDPSSGGCRDALHADRANQNQGAESTLAFYLSLVEMQLAQNTLLVEAKMTDHSHILQPV